MNDDKRFAVLIDADNVSDKYVKEIFDELSNYGTVTYKRIYGDWTGSNMTMWKKILLNHSITPIQQYAYTTGKNATDSAMIIDAMDILYTGKVHGFCIVSSDSDFTRLASRLRESGMEVIGMGEKKTPQPFVTACDSFKYLDVLAKTQPLSIQEQPVAPVQETDITPVKTILKAIISIVDDISDDEGWSALSAVGNVLIKRFSDFDVRNYGFSKLTPFIKSFDLFEIKGVAKNNINLMYIRNGNPIKQAMYFKK